MNSQRHRSKSGGWRAKTTVDETRTERVARIYATKAAAKKRAKKLERAEPKNTPERVAARAEKAKAAALKLFAKWLARPEVTRLAGVPGEYGLVHWVKRGLPGILPDPLPEVPVEEKRTPPAGKKRDGRRTQIRDRHKQVDRIPEEA